MSTRDAAGPRLGRAANPQPQEKLVMTAREYFEKTGIHLPTAHAIAKPQAMPHATLQATFRSLRRGESNPQDNPKISIQVEHTLLETHTPASHL